MSSKIFFINNPVPPKIVVLLKTPMFDVRSRVPGCSMNNNNGIARTEKTIEELSRQLDFVFKKI